MPTREQWTQLRELDRLYLKTKGTYRERYFVEQINNLRGKMGLPRWTPAGTNRNTAAQEHLPDGLTANAELFPDL